MTPRLLDHVGLVGDALAPLRAAWTRLGFAPTEPRPLLGRGATGEPVPLGQSSCHAVFDGGYVELTAVDAGTERHHLDPWRRHGAGLWIVAFGAADVAAARARCAAAGLAVTPAMDAARAIDYGARHGEARFRWFMLDAAASPEALLCVVEHRTPELVFQPEVRRHPNGARALRGLQIVVADPAAAAERYERLLGCAARDEGGARVLSLGCETLELLTPAGFAARFGRPAPAHPGPAALQVEVADLPACGALLAAAGVDVARSPRGGLLVGPADAGQVVLEFLG